METGGDELTFYINGKQVNERNADPEMTLLTYLRTKCRLTGTKLGCGEGGCGACTVMVSRYDRKAEKILHCAVNACLAPLCSVHGMAITTVEGVGSTTTKLHPIQERLVAAHGSQCGFCTPGIVMSMYALLRTHPHPSRQLLDQAFQGNLCRCTGYRPIVAGMETFTKESRCRMGADCCRNRKSTSTDNHKSTETRDAGDMNGICDEEAFFGSIWDQDAFESYDPSQEPIFPSELQVSDKYDTDSLMFRGPRVTWYRPVSMAELLALKDKHPEAKLITGNTEIGVETKLKHQLYPVLVSTSHVRELAELRQTKSGIYVGSATTLERLGEELKRAVEELPGYQTRIFAATVEMLTLFAGPQIRNVAAVGGNIMTASPISDLNPLFQAAGVTLHVTSMGGGARTIVMDDSFFVGYRRTTLNPDEVLQGVLIPYTRQNEYFCGFKQARRRDDDIAIVNAGMKVVFEDGSDIIQSLHLSYGGMAPCTVVAKGTMTQLVGRRWDADLVTLACPMLEKDLPLDPGAPGGMESYRRSLTTSFFYKFYIHVLQQRNQSDSVDSTHLSATQGPPLKSTSGSQILQVTNAGAPHPVGKPIPHLSATKQTTGEAVYIDDMPTYTDELHLALVISTRAHARIVNVDSSGALCMPGVVSYIDHTDVQGKNETGAFDKDEQIFASNLVTCQGQVIGAVVAQTATQAQQAAYKVKVEYEDLTPIITIEAAIAADSYYEPHNSIVYGDVATSFDTAPHVVSGQVRMGGQEHFYLETQATVAVPRGEDGDMEIFCSCQSPSEAQMLVADALGVGAHKVTVRVKRMGGGFGGKQTRYSTVLLPVVVAATKLRRPVRCMLDRDVDMAVTGTRHPYLGNYKVGFTPDGLLLGVDLQMYSNAGTSADLSWAVLEKTLLTADNAYYLPTARIAGHLCRTNIPSNTAFRGFGGPQGVFFIETILQHVAEHLNLLPHQVRQLNLYKDGQETPYRMKVHDANIRKCWDDVIKQSDFNHLQEEVHTFNRDNRWKKRGLAVNPTKFGISFTELFFNQAGALVNIYNDGTVLVAHCGTEMGQGLHTKMVQVASTVLSIPVSKIHINDTSTASVPNMSPTAASSGSDLNGMAVMNACKVLAERLAPYRERSPEASWEKCVSDAYFDRVNLSANGYYKTPVVTGYDWDSSEPSTMPYSYFTAGAAVTEVEIDCLTGDHVVLRTDIVMDIGQSLNPAIDVGQIEGGFVQGYGLFTLEELRFSPDGFIFTRGPGAYKIPGFGDIPQQFNVTLLKGTANPRAVYSSKGIGEPPLTLGVNAFFAIREAIRAARHDSGLSGYFRLDSPATAERIRMGCQDQFTQQFPTPEPGTYTPWTVDL